MKRMIAVLFAVTMAAGVLSAGEKKLMHCFAFTAIASATEADWAAFNKATDQLPEKIPGLTRVWHGKLRGAMDEGESARTHGVCMEMNDAATLKAYAGHEAHKAWQAVYVKVRKPGTTTFDILGE
jgi:hypothetical protein